MRLRLTGWDKSIGFAADNRTLVTATGDSTQILTWDAKTGQLLREINTDPFPPQFMRMVPDGNGIITYGSHRLAGEQPVVHAVQFWDLEKGKLQSIFDVNLDRIEEVRAIEVTPDGRSLVLGTSAGNLRVFDIQSGQEILKQKVGEREVAAVAISPDGELIAAAINLDGLYFWEWLSGGQPERPQQKRAGSGIISLAFTPDGASLAAAHHSSEGLKIWNVAEKRVHLEVVDGAGKGPRIPRMAFVNDGKVLVAANAIWGPEHEPGVLLWNVATGERIRRIKIGGHGVSALAVSPDGHMVAAMGDSACGVWNLDSGEELSGNLIGHFEPISSIAFAKGNSQVVTADYGGSVRIWDAASGEQIRMWDHSGKWRPAVCVSPDQSWIVSSAEDVRVWHAKTGEEKYRLAGHEGSRRAIAFTVDGRRLISWGGGDQLLRIWELESGKAINEYDVDPLPKQKEILEGHPLGRSAVLEFEAYSLSGDGRRLCVTIGEFLYVYDAVTGEKLSELPVIGRSNAREIQLSPDGTKLFVSAAEDRQLYDQLTAQMIDLASGKVDWQAKLPKGMCGPSGFSPDGSLVAATVRDQSGAIVVWDAASGTEQHRIEGVPEVAWGGLGKKLAISSDNTRLALAMMNTSTLVWDISAAK
jgi:WD40 repeat protein